MGQIVQSLTCFINPFIKGWMTVGVCYCHGPHNRYLARRSDKSFAVVNAVMTVLFILNWITTCIYNSTASILIASSDDREEVKVQFQKNRTSRKTYSEYVQHSAKGED